MAALEGVWPILVLMQPLTMPIYVWEGVVMGATDSGFLARDLLTSMASLLVVLSSSYPWIGIFQAFGGRLWFSALSGPYI